MPRKARAPRTVEDNISFQAHKIVTTLQSVPKLKLPTPEEAAQQLLMQAIRNVQAKQDTMPPTSDPVDWIERNFYIPETRQPVTLAPYQERALRAALALDERKLFKYSTIIWSDIKKSAKTTVGAATIDWLMANMPYASAKIIANDLKQADSRAANMLRLNFKLHERDGVKVTPSGYKVEYPNSSVVESIPIDPTGEAGGNDNIIEYDELWGSHSEAQQRMWTELTTSPTKFGKSFRMVTTYAGFLGESNLLWNLYLQGVSPDIHPDGQGTRFDWAYEFDPPLDCFYNERARIFCLWNTVPRHAWQTPEYYAAEAGVLTAEEFARVHRNQWASASTPFVPIQWWDECAQELPVLDNRTPMVLGVDAGVSNDYFAAVGVTHHPTTPQDRASVAVRYVRVWKPPRGGSLDFDKIEDELRDDVIKNKEKYNVKLVTYDSYQLHQMMGRVKKYAWTRAFSQGKDRWISDKQLRDLIMQRRIAHDGNMELRQAVSNASAKYAGEKLRIEKRSDALKVDACVALAMACGQLLDPMLNFANG